MVSDDSPSEYEKIARLQDKDDEIRDILFFNSVVSNNNPSQFGHGRKTDAFGSKKGAESWQWGDSPVIDLDINQVATAVFDKVDVLSTALTLIGPVGTLVVKTFQNILDGRIFTITPGVGRTVELTPGGVSGVNGKPIDIPSTVTLTDKDIVMCQYSKDTDMVKIITSGSSASTIPDGTVENEHLEWDNSSGDWLAVTFFTMGATGPFADQGGLRYPNDVIWVAGRTGGDDGNIELKFTTQDELDLTNSNNSTVSFLLRSQHATEIDRLFLISQASGDSGNAGLTAHNNLFINTNLVTTNVLFSPTSALFGTDINVNTFDVIGVDRLLFADSAGNFGSNSDTGIVRTVNGLVRNVPTGDRHDWNIENVLMMDLRQLGTPLGTRFELQSDTGTVRMNWFHDHVANDNAVIHIMSWNSQNVATSTIEYARLDIENEQNDTGDEAGSVAWSVRDVSMDLYLTFNNNRDDQVRLFKNLIMDGTNDIELNGNRLFLDTSATDTFIELDDTFDRIQFFTDDSANEKVAIHSAGMQVGIAGNNMVLEVHSFVRHIPTDAVTSTNGDIYYDLSENKFKGHENGVTVDLIGGGGSGPPFDDNQVIIQDEADNTKTLTFNLSLQTTGAVNLLSWASGGSRTHTFSATTGTIAQLNLAQTWTALQTFDITSAGEGIKMADGTKLEFENDDLVGNFEMHGEINMKDPADLSVTSRDGLEIDMNTGAVPDTEVFQVGDGVDPWFLINDSNVRFNTIRTGAVAYNMILSRDIIPSGGDPVMAIFGESKISASVRHKFGFIQIDTITVSSTPATNIGRIRLGAVSNNTLNSGIVIDGVGGSSSVALNFYNTATPVVRPTITGSRAGNAALASLLTALASQGLIIDSSGA